MDFSPGPHAMLSPDDNQTGFLQSSSPSSTITPSKHDGGEVKYTTVGSIYKPAASLPLQPPARRGRIIKWPPTPVVDNTRFSKTSVSSATLRSNSQAGSSGTQQSNPYSLQYAPLQQNIDRAVSPTTISDPFFATYSMEDPQKPLSRLSPPAYGPRNSATLPSVPSTSTGIGDWGDSSHRDEEDDNNGDDKLSHFSMKGLTSLASYPNPNQKAAQERLQRARPLPSPGNASVGDSQSLFVKSSALDSSADMPLIGSSSSQSLDSTWGKWTESFGEKSSGWSAPGSVGASKLGIPQPLTAGPPGRRQVQTVGQQMSLYKFLATSAQKLPQTTTGHENTSIKIAHQSSFSPFQNTDTPLHTPTFLGEDYLPSDVLSSANKTTHKVYDTLTPDKARRWFGGALPSDFDHDTRILDDEWVEDTMMEQSSKQHGQWRLAQAASHFSSGHKQFCLASAGGEKEADRPISPLTKLIKGSTIVGRMTIDQANMTPTSEHANFLLQLLFKSLKSREGLDQATAK